MPDTRMDIDLNAAFERNQSAVAKVMALLALASTAYSQTGATSEERAIDEAISVLAEVNEVMTGMPFDRLHEIVMAEVRKLGYENVPERAH